jgi:hypothetical protein
MSITFNTFTRIPSNGQLAVGINYPTTTLLLHAPYAETKKADMLVALVVELQGKIAREQKRGRW